MGMVDDLRFAAEVSYKAWEKWGAEEQLMVLCEESAELIAAANKLRRTIREYREKGSTSEYWRVLSKQDNFVEEIADTVIVILGAVQNFGIETAVVDSIIRKTLRLKAMIREANNGR